MDSAAVFPSLMQWGTGGASFGVVFVLGNIALKFLQERTAWKRLTQVDMTEAGTSAMARVVNVATETAELAAERAKHAEEKAEQTNERFDQLRKDHRHLEDEFHEQQRECVAKIESLERKLESYSERLHALGAGLLAGMDEDEEREG